MAVESCSVLEVWALFAARKLGESRVHVGDVNVSVSVCVFVSTAVQGGGSVVTAFECVFMINMCVCSSTAAVQKV